MEASAIFGRLFAAIAAIVLLYILYTVIKQAWAHHQPLQQTAGSSSSSFSIWKWGRGQPSRRQYAPLDAVMEEEEGEGDDLRSYHDSNSVNATPVSAQGPWSDEDAWESMVGQGQDQQQGRRLLSAGVAKPLPERPLPDKPLPPVPGNSKGKG